MHIPHCFVLFEIFTLTLALQSSSPATTSGKDELFTSSPQDITKLHVLNVQISMEISMSNENCSDILQKLEKTISNASSLIHKSLDGRLFIRTVNIFLPSTWHNSCFPAPPITNISPFNPYSSSNVDISITSEHRIFKNEMWTKQYGGCGTKGSKIYVPYKSLYTEASGKKFAKEWSKYQFGIFDEHGYPNDSVFPLCYYKTPQTNYVTSCSDNEEIEYTNKCVSSNFILPISAKANTSFMYAPDGPNASIFCDSGNHDRYAPTKQNYLCERKPTLDIILNNSILNELSKVPNSGNLTKPEPKFIYHRITVWRYIVIIDESIANARRDSWNFLRIALRKWVLYDLKERIEIGIILASGNSVIRGLDLTLLKGSKERELVAAYLPYTINTIQSSKKNARATCLTCALKRAYEVLAIADRSQTHIAHDTIVVVAPGIDLNIDTNEKINKLIAIGKNKDVITINYPDINNRQPLEKLATAMEGSAFTVQELRYNSERSLIQTYFQLSTLLMQLAHTTDSARPSLDEIRLDEIYRNVIYEANGISSGNSHQNFGLILSKGNFYFDADTYDNAEFLVYTHTTDLPLINGLKLISPTGRTYTSLSDQRMAVKQLTLLASIDEDGLWEYYIEHFNSGTTQPYIVQVVAQTKANTRQIQTHLNIQHSEPNVVTVACEISHGKYPILNANATLLVTRYEISNPNSYQREFITLHDTGFSSGSDLIRNDGIYTSQIPITQPGIYSFEVKINGSENETFTIFEHAESNVTDFPEKCCGSFYSQQVEKEMGKITSGKLSTLRLQDFKYIETIKTFKRYTKQKYLYIYDQGNFKDQSETELTSKILDFNVKYLNQQEDAIVFSWSLPNKNLLPLHKKQTINYEVRFSQYLKDLTDHFDVCEKLPDLTTSIKLSDYLEHFAYTVKIDQLPLYIWGKLLTFAVRQIPENPLTRTPAISNIQQIKITNLPPKSSTEPKIHEIYTTLYGERHTTNKIDYDGLHSNHTNNTFYSINSLNANESADWSLKSQIFCYIIPALIAFVAAITISTFLCFILKCRRNYKNSSKSIQKSTVFSINKCHTKLTNSKENAYVAGSDADDGLKKSGYETMESQSLYTADHHTLGIPMYSHEEINNISTTIHAKFNEDQSYWGLTHPPPTPFHHSLNEPPHETISNTTPPLPPSPTETRLHVLNYSYNHGNPIPLRRDENEICNHQPCLIINKSSLLMEGIDTSCAAKQSRSVTMV